MNPNLMFGLSVINRIKQEIEKTGDNKLLESFIQSYSPNQISSKLWLVDELKKHTPLGTYNVEVVGSWFGYPLVFFIREYMSEASSFAQRIVLYDIDDKACEICDRYRTYFHDENIVIKNMDYWKDFSERKDVDVVINTSSEHMKGSHSMNFVLYDDPIHAIQSNNMDIDEHINLCHSEDELAEKHDFEEILYKGTKRMNNGSLDQYRYMVIGKI